MDICFKTINYGLNKNVCLGQNNRKNLNLSLIQKDTVSFGSNELETSNIVGGGKKN